MRDDNFKEKNKTHRTIIKGIFSVVVAIITALGSIAVILITIYLKPPAPPKSDEPDILSNTSILYYGESHLEYNYSNETFSIGANNYNCGFTIKSPNANDKPSSPNGFVILDLNNKYSKVSFSVGRTNGDLNSNASLIIYINNVYDKEYRLQGKSSSIDIEIDVKNVKSLRIELKTEKECVYGFANILLYK